MTVKQLIRRATHILPDALFIRIAYFRRLHRLPDLKHPRTFTEKLQWLKLHDRDPMYTQLVDKYEVRSHVARTIGEEHLIPLLGGPWASFDDIDFDALPRQFVLKCTHDSGGIIICRDKAQLDLQQARQKLETSLRQNFYYHSREWPYRDVTPRIIVEKYVEDESGAPLTDYKVFCFDGEPRVILTVTGGHDSEAATVRRMYDTDWNLLPIALHGKPCVQELQPRPAQLEELLRLSRVLSRGLRHVRTDFYVIGGRVFFGEITFYHMSGMARIDPPEWNEKLGSWIRLPTDRE